MRVLKHALIRALSLSLLGGLIFSSTSRAGAKPNILFILTDDQR